jgi:hypothetical protein
MKPFDLEQIKRAIAEKYHWGPSAEWTNFHFKELSKAIEELTGDRISEETLKRIFGKRKVNSENYQPQAFSQMALQKFAESLENAPAYPGKKAIGKKIYWLIGAILVVGAVVLVMMILARPLEKKANYQFSCENPVDYYPFTASFSYDVSEIGDSVFTDFGRAQETYLPPERKMINYFYSNTGVYPVRFYTRSRVLDSLKVTALASDWQGGYFPNSSPGLFQPFINQNIYKQPDCFYASPEKLKSEGVDLNQKYWITYRLFSPFNKSLDSLTLETKVLNNASTGSLVCYDIEITLVGETGTVDFKFTQLKCSRHANLRVSEKYLDGEFDDLSALSVDLSDWLPIKMNTSGGQFTIELDGKPVFSEEYKQPLGNLLGVVFSFFGSGKIDYLELKETSGESFYSSSFSPAESTAGKPE